MGLIQFFIKKSLSVLRLGQKWVQRLLCRLGRAVFGNTYVETIASFMSDTLHKEIKWSDAETFRKYFELCVRHTVKKLKLKKVKVAIDVTEDLYWGKKTLQTRPSTKKGKHQVESWQWVNLSIVEPCFVPLMSLPYRQIDDLDELVIELLEYLETFDLEVELVLFDRGFYHWHLIDYLNGYRRGWNWPYLIFVPKNDAMKEFIKQTKGKIGSFIHQKKYSKDKSTWRPKTRIVILKGATKNKKGELVDWCFATNQKAQESLLQTYRIRWNIETGFRVHDEAKIKTKSQIPIVRYFYHLLSFVYMLNWICRKTKEKIVFKYYLCLEQDKYSVQPITYPP